MALRNPNLGPFPAGNLSQVVSCTNPPSPPTRRTAKSTRTGASGPPKGRPGQALVRGRLGALSHWATLRCIPALPTQMWLTTFTQQEKPPHKRPPQLTTRWPRPNSPDTPFTGSNPQCGQPFPWPCWAGGGEYKQTNKQTKRKRNKSGFI